MQINTKKFLIVLITIVATIFMVACSTTTEDDTTDPQVTGTSPIIYGDSWNSDLTDKSAYYGTNNGAGLVTDDDDTAANVKTGTQAYKFDFSGIPTGAYAGIFSKFTPAKDFSAYNTLSFDVKASSATASVELVQFEQNGVNYALKGFSVAGVADPARVVFGSTTYQTVTIPYYGATGLDKLTIAFQTQAVQGTDTLGTLYFDNIQLTKTSTLPTIAKLDISTGGITIFAKIGAADEQGAYSLGNLDATAFLDDDTASATTYNKKIAGKLQHFSKNIVSKAPAVATVSNLAVTGVAVGTTQLQKVTTQNTDVISVQVFAADTAADKYYLYGDKVDFTGAFYPNYENTIITTFENDNTVGEYIRMRDTNANEWAAGGFQSIKTAINTTGYHSLVVKARATATGTPNNSKLVILLKFDNDGKAGAGINITDYNNTGAATATALSTTWYSYRIPLSVLKGTQTSTSLTYVNLEFPFELATVNPRTVYQVEIDEIYLDNAAATAPTTTPTSTNLNALTLSYIDGNARSLTVPAATAFTLNPTWTNTVPTATYAFTTTAPTGVTVGNTTGIINFAATTAATALATHTIQATGTGNFNGTKNASIAIEILAKDATANKYYLHGDGGIDYAGYIFPGYNGTLTVADFFQATGGANSTAKYIKLRATGSVTWGSNGGWQFPTRIDLTGKTNLHLWAKATVATSTLIVEMKSEEATARYDADPGSTQNANYIAPITVIAYADTDNDGTIDSADADQNNTAPTQLKTSWTKYIIPISAFTTVDTVFNRTKVSVFSLEVNDADGSNANTANIDVDEIYFE